MGVKRIHKNIQVIRMTKTNITIIVDICISNKTQMI